MRIVTHYERLGVRADAPTTEIRAAYHRLARQLHPDVASAAVGGEMASLNEAWRVLSDPARRALYDAGLRDRRGASNGRGQPDTQWEQRLGQMVDIDDDTEFTPAAPWQRRIPLWAMLLLSTLAVIFLITAYAGSARNGTPARSPAGGAIVVGSCVRLVSGGLAENVACTAPNDGTVVATISYDGRCPTGSSGYRRRDAVAGYACVGHR